MKLIFKMRVAHAMLIAIMVISCSVSAKEAVELGSKKAPVDPQSYDESGFRNLIAAIAENTVPVVVSIKTSKSIGVQQYGEFWDNFFFGPGFRQNPKAQKRKQEGLGSGVIVSKDGYILTNNHVIENADEIKVVLHDEQVFDAEIVGTDRQTDIAVIKLKKNVKNLPVAHLGDSDDLKIGEWVVAIGNPFGLNHTVTKGIVSAKEIHGRGLSDYENFIQTDAAINPGNSGGALLNLHGSLVGINTAILSRTGGFQGIGFAVPINLAKKVVYDLIDHGKVSRGWLGVSIQDLTPTLAKALKAKGKKGVIISQILADTPAEKSDLKEGDIIISVNNKKTKNVNELRNYIALLRAGSKASFKVIRQGDTKTIEVVIGSRDTDGVSITGDGTASGAFGLSVSEIDNNMSRNFRIPSNTSGVVVTGVDNNSSAYDAGIRRGDIISKINYRRTDSLKKYRSVVKKLKKGETAILLINRDGRRMFVALEL